MRRRIHGDDPNPPGTDTSHLEARAVGPDPEWAAEALCRDADPEMFFPEKGGNTRAAKRLCRRCPVQEECLDHALVHGERHGIWGGMSERHRRRAARMGKRARDILGSRRDRQERS